MTAMHPDSGVPPQDARNSLTNDAEASQYCDELWYSTSRCQPRFDPAAANAMLAELINLINKGEVVYDCRFLDQVQYAVRYICQRGKTRAALMIPGGPGAENNYTATLDPQATYYNDYMTCSFVPQSTNNGPVYINCNGLGFVPLVRSSGAPCDDGDLPKGIPFEAIYYAGKWYIVGAGAFDYGIAGQWFEGPGMTFVPPGGVITGWANWDAGRGHPNVLAGFNPSNSLYTIPPRLGGLWLFQGYCNTLTGPQDGQASVPGFGFRLYKGPISGDNIISAVTTPANRFVHGTVSSYCDLRSGDTMQLASLANETGLTFRHYSFTAVRIGQSATRIGP